MEISRRSLFKTLLGGIAAASVLDPEKLLWNADAKTIFIPNPPALAFHKDAFQMVCSTADFLKGDVLTFSGHYEFDPYTRKYTGTLKRFVVTADCKVDDLKVAPFQWNLGEHAHILNR